MKKVIRLTENDIRNIVCNVINKTIIGQIIELLQ